MLNGTRSVQGKQQFYSSVATLFQSSPSLVTRYLAQDKNFNRVISDKKNIDCENKIIELEAELTKTFNRAHTLENILKIRYGGTIEQPTEELEEIQ